MPSHSNPSILELIKADARLLQKYADLELELSTDLRKMFGAIPAISDATVIHIEEIVVQYPRDVIAMEQEFVVGAQRAIPRSWRTKYPVSAAIVDTRVMLFLTQVFQWWPAAYDKVSRNLAFQTEGFSVAVGLYSDIRGGPEWAPLPSFRAAAVLLAIWPTR